MDREDTSNGTKPHRPPLDTTRATDLQSTNSIIHIHDPETNEPIIPMMPYISPKDKRFCQIPYMPFMDYKTSKSYKENTEFYWKPMPEVIESYLKHPESKFDGNIGRLQRKHIVIDKNSIQYIGKESNELEESEVLGVDKDNYATYNDNECIKHKILEMKEEDAIKIGISARTLYYWKARIREGKKIELYDKVKSKLTITKGEKSKDDIFTLNPDYDLNN